MAVFVQERDDKPICRIEAVIRDSAGADCVTGTTTTYTMPLKGAWTASGITSEVPTTMGACARARCRH